MERNKRRPIKERFIHPSVLKEHYTHYTHICIYVRRMKEPRSRWEFAVPKYKTFEPIDFESTVHNTSNCVPSI